MKIPYITELSCICGNHVRLEADTPEELLAAATIWKNAHSGPGHRRCSLERALRVRGKVEVEAAKVEVENGNN